MPRGVFNRKKQQPEPEERGAEAERGELVNLTRKVMHALVDVQLGLRKLSDEERNSMQKLRETIEERLKATGTNVQQMAPGKKSA